MIEKIKSFFWLIKFEHSIFALPFAYLGLFLAEGGLPRFSIFLWVTVAMVSIRTAGMCFNRLIDEPIDAKNPRTKARSQSIQFLTRPVLWAITGFVLILFVLSAGLLNHLCLSLSPVPIFLVWAYPHLKKFTWLSHFVLGMILSIAPYAGWLAAGGEWSWVPFLLTVAVFTWVSGFDLFYALQDVEFDQSHQLKSFPARFGTESTLWAVRILHSTTLISLSLFGFILKMGLWYWLGWSAALVLILKEHRLVARFGLGKINEAFFNMNAWVSVVIFVAVAMDLTFHF